MDDEIRRVVRGADGAGTTRVWFDGPSPDGHGVPVEIAPAAGDTNVVHGGKHAWSNRGAPTAALATIAGADPKSG
jgi:hypothetical protein